MFCFVAFLSLFETVSPVLDHLWTQDSPICPLTLGGKLGPYIDQGSSTTKVCFVFVSFFENNSRLTFERSQVFGRTIGPFKGLCQVSV